MAGLFLSYNMNINDSRYTAQRSYRYQIPDLDFLDWLETDLDNSSIVQDLLQWKCTGNGFGKITDEDRTLLNNYYLERFQSYK